MKYAKILGLAAMAIAAMMAFAGTASATILTSPSGTTYTSTIKSSSTNTELVGELGTFSTIKCTSSTVEGKVESHGASVTAGGAISSLTFSGCTGGTPTTPVAQPGSLEVHTEGASSNGNGTLTSKSAKVIVHNTAVGTCTFETGSTGDDIGEVTGGTPAVLTISAKVIRVSGTNPFCGSSSTWKGTYTVSSPGTLLVD